MKNQEIKIFSKIVIPINVIISVVSICVLLLLRKYSWTLGFLLGSCTSYITYLMHVNNVNKMSEYTRSPRKSATSSYLLRLLVSAIPLAVALYFSAFDIVATFIGLLTIKVTMVIALVIFEIKNPTIKEGGID